jgi:uncharacterized protein
MVRDSTIQKAADALLAAAPAGSQLFLFGSQASGTADDRSDVDFLVVEPQVEDRVREMLRLADSVRPLKIPVDIVVLSSQAFDYWKNTPNSLAYRVAKEGRLYGSTTRIG